METRSILYFIAVAEGGNIGQAATRLGITQPALSQQIRLLENEIGVTLFNRTRTGVELTPAGIDFLQRAYTIKTELSRAKAIVQQARDEQPESLNVGVFGLGMFTVVSQILAPFIQKNKNVALKLHTGRKDQHIKMLHTGELLIFFDRNLIPDPHLTCELVNKEYFTHMALHKNHSFASREIIDISDLSGERRIGANFDRTLADYLTNVTDYRAKSGDESRIRYRTDDILSCLGLVSCNEATVAVPASALALGIPNVVYCRLSGGEKYPNNLQCMYRTNDKSPLLYALLEEIRKFRESV